MDVFKAAKKIFDEVASIDGKLVVGIEIKDPARDAYAGDVAISTLMLLAKIREFEHSIGRLVKVVAIDTPEKKRPEDPLVQYVTRSGLAILGPCAELVSKKGPVMRYAVLDVGEEIPDKPAKPPEKALKKAYEIAQMCPVGACGEEFDYKACESYRKKTIKRFSKKLYLKCVLCRYLKVRRSFLSMRYESRIIKVLIVLLIVVPLIISSVVIFWEYPAPKPGPSGEERFSNFSPLMPNYPNPPNVTAQTPPELKDILNLTIAYVNRNDVFIRLRCGQVFRDGKRLPYYTRPTSSPSSTMPPYAIPVEIRRNATVSGLIGKAMNMPNYAGSYVILSNRTVVVGTDLLSADAVGQLYVPEGVEEISYTLGVLNSSELNRPSMSLPISAGRAFLDSHPRILENTPKNDYVINVANSLKISSGTIYEQVGVVLAYMYAHVTLANVTLTDPLDSLVEGKANIEDRLTTFVALLRLTGVPANVAYGFIPENETEHGMYIVKVKDLFPFVEIYDLNTRITFDPFSSTPLLLHMMNKEYPINVYPADVSAYVADVSGGDAIYPFNDTYIIAFDVNSASYSKSFTVTVYAEVMGSPIRFCPVNATRYSLNYSEKIDEFSVQSNATGYATATEEVTYDNAVPGFSVFMLSYNGRTFAGVFLFIRVATTISPMCSSIYIYVPIARVVHEEIGRTNFLAPRTLREALRYF